MKKYDKLITRTAILLLLIILIVVVMVFDINLLFAKNLSIASIEKRKLAFEELIKKETLEAQNNEMAKSTLQSSKNSFDMEKEKYENINESTIEIVQEATKEEKYFIEYLWVVLGNYASRNNLSINIETPGATTVKTTTEESTNQGSNAAQNSTKANTANAASASTNMQSSISGMQNMGSLSDSTATDGITILVKGRYSDVADFVFDVENDSSLKFKLDNIKMTYSGDNKISATFKILSLSVLQ